MSQPRRFDNLRGGNAPTRTASQEEPIESVMRRLFLTGSDGPRVLAWMREDAGKVTRPNAPEAELREAEGARRFVARLSELMIGKSPG